MNGSLGFGCAGLSSLNNDKSALRLLEYSYELGISHFDVARLYGMGQTEAILGRFSIGKRDKITITTKFGLDPPQLAFQGNTLYKVAKAIIKEFPLVKKLAVKRIHANFNHVYTSEHARRSLEKSLTELKTDYVDYFLIHESNFEESVNEDLINTLENFIREGKILNYGIGTTFNKINNNLSEYPEGMSTFQFESTIHKNNLASLKNHTNKKLFTHSSLQEIKNFKNIDEINNNIRGQDGNLENAIGALLLYFNYLNNPTGVVLFSSIDMKKIKSNISSFNTIRKLGWDLNTILSILGESGNN